MENILLKKLFYFTYFLGFILKITCTNIKIIKNK